MGPKIVGGNDRIIFYNTRVNQKRKQAMLRSNLWAIWFIKWN